MTRTRWWWPILAVAAMASAHAAQDPLVLLPDAYRLEFENPWARVIRVRYPAHARLPEHDHTDWAAAFVYLNASGPVVFRHVGASYTDVTRPPTQAGGFRLNKSYLPNRETHEVENASDRPSEFLRVELKTVALDPDSLKGRFPPIRADDGKNLVRVQFSNPQVRVTRLIWGPGRSMTIKTGRREPSLLVWLTPARLRINRPVPSSLDLPAGEVYWLDERSRQSFANTDRQPVEALRFDFLTPPQPAAGSGQTSGR